MHRILLIAYHFPPFAQSSGLQRTLRFAEYLPEYGWQAVVLTASHSGYEVIDPPSERLIPQGCRVVRLPCLDASRQLAWRGRYPRSLSLPDRWASWAAFARLLAPSVCRKEGIDVIWSTYPIATAHLIGGRLARKTGLPWVADFRDPMVQLDYPEDRRQRASFQRIERLVGCTASALVFTTPSAVETYRRRFPEVHPSRFALLENGYDERTFQKVEASLAAASRRAGDQPSRFILLHSGIVYPSERDPAPLFAALGRLKRAGAIAASDLLVRFRAPVHEDMLKRLMTQEGIGDLIEILPPVPYAEAASEMLSADALLVLQSSSCDEQIPAKLYEYLRAGRPILALANPSGDTGRRLVSLGFDSVVPLESSHCIEAALPIFISRVRSGAAFLLQAEKVKAFDRRRITGQLARLLNAITDRSNRNGPVVTD